MSAAAGMHMVAGFGVNDITVGIVLVIVVMGVNGDLRRHHRPAQRIAKERKVGRVIGDLFRVAVAAYMLVEADDCVGSCHHQMQVVGD